MAEPTFKLLGDKEMAAALAQMGEEVVAEIEGVAMEAAKPLLQEIKANAPRDSGDMANSIGLSKQPKGDLTAEVAVGPKKDFYYWLFNEMGAPGHDQPARPFIRPAYDKLEGQILDDIAAGINRILERHESE